MILFDTHCHLNDPILYKDLEKNINEAQDVGVKYFLVVGYSLETSILALEIAKTHDNIYAAVGLHPSEVKNFNQEIDKIKELAKDDKVVAIGEIGLDYYWEKDSQVREYQKETFIKQIEFANQIDKPISIHCRDAYEDCLKILKEHTPKRGGIMHCYGGSVELSREFIKLGFYISLGGPVTYKNAKTPKAVAKEVFLDKLLLETDSPYLTPTPHRGEVNYPKFVELVAKEISAIREENEELIGKQTTENALKLFHVKTND